MALSVDIGAFNITTGAAGNTVAVTTGFTPKAIIFWWNGRTESTDTAGGATHLRGMGFATSASDFRAVCGRDEDGLGTAQTNSGHRNDACIAEISDTAFVGWADLQSMDATGFTLEIIDAFPTDLRVMYWAVGGSDITDAEIVEFVAAGVAPVNQTINNVGNFQPDIAFFLGTGEHAINALDPTCGSGLAFGVAKDATDEAVLYSGSDDAEALGDAGSYCRSGECFISQRGNIGASPTVRAEFVSHNASPGGITINWLERGRATRVFTLMIKGGQWAVGNLLTQTDTTTDIVESGLGFTPTSVLFASGCKAETVADAAGGANDEWSVGAAMSASDRFAAQVSSRDGNTTMFVQTAVEYDEVYINQDPATDAIEGLMDVKSFDSDGFTCIMDDADPAQAFVFYVAVGTAGGGAFTLAADAGSYSVTGQASGVRAGRQVSAVAGSYALTGQAAGVRAGRSIGAVAGSYAITGQAAALWAAHRLSAVAGVYSITGQAATLTYGPAAGSFVLSAEPGVYALTGQAAVLRATHKIAANVGSYALTGQSAGVAVGRRLAAVAGSYTITGQGATFRSTRSLLAASGSYAITGSAATFVWSGQVVQAPEADYVITVRADVGVIRVRSDVGVIEIT